MPDVSFGPFRRFVTTSAGCTTPTRPLFGLEEAHKSPRRPTGANEEEKGPRGGSTHHHQPPTTTTSTPAAPPAPPSPGHETRLRPIFSHSIHHHHHHWG